MSNQHSPWILTILWSIILIISYILLDVLYHDINESMSSIGVTYTKQIIHGILLVAFMVVYYHSKDDPENQI